MGSNPLFTYITTEVVLVDPSILSGTPLGRGEFPGGRTQFFSECTHPGARKFSECLHLRADFMLKIKYFCINFYHLC